MDRRVKHLWKNYDKLEELERFKLVMDAFERSDEKEIRTIQETAPKAIYEMLAWPYRGMLEGISQVAWVVVTALLHSGLAMTMPFLVDGLKGEIDLERWGMAFDGANEATATWDGFILFCEDLGVATCQVLALAPRLPLIETVIELAEIVLDMERNLTGHLLNECYSMTDELYPEADEVMHERAERSAQKRAKAAKQCALSLQSIWEQEAGM